MRLSLPDVVAVLPALSVTEAVQVSVVSVVWVVTLPGAASPDRASFATQVSLAVPGASTVVPFLAPVTLTDGLTWSMLIGETTTVATPPSLAWIVFDTICAAALRLSVTGPGHALVSGADPGVHRKRTVTGDRYQPNLLFGVALETEAVIFGFLVAVEAEDAANEPSPL